MSLTRSLCSGLLVLMLAGCATYAERQSTALEAVEQGDYARAESEFSDALADRERDILLYHLEIGMVRHLAGDYEGSNAVLQWADDARDHLTYGGYGAQVGAFLTSPALGLYRGMSYEFAYVNYLKALNYLALAQQDNDPRWLDAARVESRRLEIILNEFAADEGDYLERATAEDDTASAFLRLLRQLRGQYLDPEDLIYRDDAWARFLNGVIYENLREWDNARIAYQQAAMAYEQGFAEQYRLGDEATRLAWTSVVRMMRTGGGWSDEWPRLVEDKGLHEPDTRPLGPDEGLVMVVEHTGRIPPIGELNLYLSLRPATRSLVLQPIISRGGEEGLAQRAWFTLHYGDHGIGDLFLRYQSGGVFQVLDNPLNSKVVPLGPLWDVAEETGFLAGIGQTGVRVSVPWYPPAGDPPRNAQLVHHESGQRLAMTPMANMEQVKRQERLRLAQEEMTAALLREIIRNTAGATAASAVSEHGDETVGLLLALLGRVATTATARAETRHWATLPRMARMGMVRMPVGEQTLQMTRGNLDLWQGSVDVQPRRVTVRYVRTTD